MRDSLVDIHKNSQSRQSVQNIPAPTDTKKIKHYKAVQSGYYKWWGRKKISWIQVQARSSYQNGNIEINVNPELHVDIGGSPHVIKLYFGDSTLQKAMASIRIGIMEMAFNGILTSSPELAVLDINPFDHLN